MWTEKNTPYGFRLVENEGGATLGYSPDSGLKLIEKDGLAFKDMAGTGERVGSGFSQYKIRELLRERCGFDGSVCTDWRVLNENFEKGELCCGWGEGIESPDGKDPDSGALALRSLMAGVDQMGGCKNDWVKDEQGQEHNYYCAAFRALLDYAMPRFQNIARAELAARRGMQ